jgi:methyl-accepting chemotaxis protein
MYMQKTIRLQVRILLFFAVTIMVLSAITTLLSVRKSLDVASSVFAREGIKLAREAAGLINGDKFEALSKSLNKNDNFYEETRLKLLKIRNDASILYLYTIAQTGEKRYRYIIDGSGEIGSDTFSDLGDEAAASDYGPSFFKAWQTQTGTNTSLEKSDWGWLVSVYEPIKNSRGIMVGLVGCDFSAGFLYESVKSQIKEQIVIGLIFAAAGVGILFFLIHPIFVRLAHISEILKILSGGGGNLSSRIEVKRRDEIGSMASLFNSTLDRISELIILRIKPSTLQMSAMNCRKT